MSRKPLSIFKQDNQWYWQQITLIKAALKAQPELWNNPRFAGHYPSHGHKRPAPVDENCQLLIQPSATRCRLDILVPNVNPSIGTAAASPSQQMPYSFRCQPIPGPSRIFTPYQPPQYISYPNDDSTNNIDPHLMHPPIRNTFAPAHNQSISPANFYYSNYNYNYPSWCIYSFFFIVCT